ncbi:MAG TPA: anthranilate phosphoribosyltransferase [Spirochaetota bacterium]|nr:anthranilate phosphoribosyltransferase [Spirochaetota bacterium]HPI87930.1 anthranilate phosphoribosyltransferase [Spirochaetota bacterium]HPR47338.1 anthranilate phosphoribosyltransferase [Spirochaetota bacterium]
MFLLVDNYDSFTYNLYALFRSCGEDVTVIKNRDFIPADDYQGIIISPGPSSPENSGTSLEYLSRYRGIKPIFGVCLGMQCMAHSLGYRVAGAPTIKHGKIDRVITSGESVLFRNVPPEFSAVRYHSLAVTVDPALITSTAASDGVTMSLEDPENLYFGVQFHPESILSEHGKTIVQNFINFARGAETRKERAMERIIKKINSGRELEMNEASSLFDAMLSGELTEAQTGAALVAMRLRGEGIDELAALVRVMDRRKIRFTHGAEKTVDTCGTGGDGKSTINVSTAVSIVLAAMGYPVVKHGNRAQSGKVGSADLLESLGYDFSYAELGAGEFFKKHNYVFMHAQHHHPALKGIGTVRRELKVPTIFNFAGPLVNPGDPAYQIIGLSSRERLVFLANVLLRLGRSNVTVYSSYDGYDEVSSADKTECISVCSGTLNHFIIDPADYFRPFDMPHVSDENEARELFLRGILGHDEQIVNILALNTALALKTMKESSMIKGYTRARDYLKSGAAGEKLYAITGGVQVPVN